MKPGSVAAVSIAVFFLTVSCSKSSPPPPVEGAVAGPAWPALALLRTGANPLWFELGAGCPAQIGSPAEAGLEPYLPWPHARFVAGMRIWEGSLVMAINRGGFLVLEAAGTGTLLYRIGDNGLWDPYTTESFFGWEGKPAVLLYRNGFFMEASAPPLRPQVYVLDRASPVPLGAEVPALAAFPGDGPWEAETLRRGPDGFWYYRMKEKGPARPGTAYFRAESLEGKGREISAAGWLDSGRPGDSGKAPALLAALLAGAEEAFPRGAAGGGPFAVKAVSPDFEEPRFFSSSAGPEGFSPLYAYCREGAEPLALAVTPGGRGLAARGSGTDIELSPFPLPALPDGFVYTGIALVNGITVASWEEQREASIGAAGFMAVNINPWERNPPPQGSGD